MADADGGGVIINRVQEGGQGEKLGIPPKSRVISINAIDATSLSRPEVINLVQTVSRPFTMTVQW